MGDEYDTDYLVQEDLPNENEPEHDPTLPQAGSAVQEEPVNSRTNTLPQKVFTVTVTVSKM